MAPTDELLIAVRAVHYGATIVLFGEMVFALLIVARSSSGPETPSDRAADAVAYRRFRHVAVAAWALMVVSGAGWLALITGQMGGMPLGELGASAVVGVIGSTVFGQAWSFRAAMALVLVLFWPIVRAGPPREPWVPVLSVGIASGLLAGLAWAGHANAEVGAAGLVHHWADAAHLLAAGVWLGGLAPLATLLKTVEASPSAFRIDESAVVATRFGNWAALSVGVLVVTGISNAYYLLPGPKALLETTYGNVLVVKLLVFALMLVIAAVNRTRLTSVLLANGGDDGARLVAASQLRRNAWLEQALGAGVVLLVALLGVSSPPVRM